MTESRRTFWLCALFIGTASLLLPSVMFATQTTVAISGLEQGASGPRWDTGSLTVTINGHSETVSFGQFSTTQSVASGLAAKFSLDCKSPVVAISSGSSIIFTTKNADDPFFEVSSAPVWDTADYAMSSFDLNHPAATPDGTVTAFLNVTCDPNPVSAGGSAGCTAQVPAGATGTVKFSIDNQPAWSTATVDSLGWAPAEILTGLAGGVTHTISASYSGDTHYNSAQQSVSLPVLSGSLVSASLYSYSISDAPNGGGTPGYTPDGNIGTYTELLGGQWLTHSMQYDALDRLLQAVVLPTGSTTGGTSLCWSYDSFGNRKLEAPVALQSGVCPSTGTVNTMAQFSDGGNHITGATYDASGNITADAINVYQYDGNGRLCAVAVPSLPGPTMMVYQYIYDADGNRVAKRVNPSYPSNQALTCDPGAAGFSVTNAYVVGSDGEQVTEMTVSSGQTSWAHTNVFAGGRLLATYDPVGLHFQVNDWLGTRRLQTNAFGQAEEVCQNSPYGNGQSCSVPSGAPATADDATEHHFTGKERDAETGGAYPQQGMDYFGARYYNSAMGRFMSADYSEEPDTIPYADPGDPQTFNLYSYVGNNPAGYDDLDGHTSNATQICPSGPLCTVFNFFQNLFSGSSNTPGTTTASNNSPSPPARPPSVGDMMGIRGPLGSGGGGPAQQQSAVSSLVAAQNAARANPNNQPSGNTTHCNSATYQICMRMGANMGPFAGYPGPNGVANKVGPNLATSPGWTEVPIDQVQALADRGILVVGSYINAKGPGHLVTVRPQGVSGDNPGPGTGPLLNNVGSSVGVMHYSRVFRKTAEVHFYVQVP